MSGRLTPERALKLETHLIELQHATSRMLQSLDAYWEHCEGLSGAKAKTVRSRSNDETWWNRYERYRAQVEALITTKGEG